jgi:tRNA threonylcarbamoyladenosine biosynthesis protein TsaE
VKARTRSPEATRALGAAIAAWLRPGDVVALVGELGSGKTTFVQGVAAGLGITARIVSPTFTIVREYEGRVPLAHVDVYRLDRLQELHDLGFEELLDGEWVTVVEWGDAVERALPAEHLAVSLEPGAAPEERIVEVHAQGAAWRDRRDAIEAAVAACADEGDG